MPTQPRIQENTRISIVSLPSTRAAFRPVQENQADEERRIHKRLTIETNQKREPERSAIPEENLLQRRPILLSLKSPDWRNFLKVIFDKKNNTSEDALASFASAMAQHVVEEDIRNLNYLSTKIHLNFDSNCYQTLQKAMLSRIAAKEKMISDYLDEKRPDMFVNSAVNMFPDVMFNLLKLLNWKNVPFCKFTVLVYKTRIRFECWETNVILCIPVGYQNPGPAFLCLVPFLHMLERARVASITMRVFGCKHFKSKYDDYLFKERHTTYRTGSYFKPCKDVHYDFNEMNSTKKNYDKKPHQKYVLYERPIDSNFGELST